MREIISTKDAPQAIGPYSQAIKANGFVFVSGQVAIEPATQRADVIPTDTGDKKPLLPFCNLERDADDLFRRFAFTIDDLRETLAE